MQWLCEKFQELENHNSQNTITGKKQQLAKNNRFYIFLMKMIIVIALLFSKWLLKGTTLVVVQIIQGNCAHFVFLNWRTCEWQRHLVSCFLPSSHNMMCHIRKMIWWIWGDIVKILLCQLNTNKHWILRILQRNRDLSKHISVIR